MHINYTVEQFEDIFDIEPNPDNPEIKEIAEQKMEEHQHLAKKIEQSKKISISKVLESFEIYDGAYKREQVDNAIELKEDITPHLIGIIKNIINSPSEHLDKENYFAHIYAFMLLGHFKEPRAHKTIVDLFSLPDDLPYKLFGDFVTENLPIVLLRTCDGSLDRIKSLVLNREAYDYCRVSALETMVLAVAEGIVGREEVLSFFGSLFTGEEAKSDSEFWELLANFVCDLYPEELMDTITKAYQDGLINPESISRQDFEETLEDGKEKCLENISETLKRKSLDDIHDYMSGWACFNLEGQTPSPPADLIAEPQKKFDSKKGKKKKKRKMVKSSRKKNRRR